MHMMTLMAPAYAVYVFIEVYSGALRGTGDVLVPMLMTCGGVCVLRVLWVWFIVPLKPVIDTILTAIQSHGADSAAVHLLLSKKMPAVPGQRRITQKRTGRFCEQFAEPPFDLKEENERYVNKIGFTWNRDPKRLPERPADLPCAVVVDDRAYLVDFGPGVCGRHPRRTIRHRPLRPDLLTTAFCTHLHTDHTVGYADLIFTPWVLERSSPLKVFGPKGLQRMTDHLLQAYAVDIDFRLHGFERANEVGYQCRCRRYRKASSTG